ncbi:wax ester/triacylglycerol synthase domain-containing protein [Saccharothrix australiensis]|uniref:diacylglycerol O-acyltransferase n=1 Tax=Saccharothrix australiensis TaxID=2072 RepID=A0A495W3X5_9PSEU|nr:wax ester/triacylglycerol synthase domain-containing protein [Saccharothrix australiensis]RKT54508.1 diacylglycerol O-acyltransferase [Saccharothrix australiensis]
MGADPFRHLTGLRTWGAVREMNAVEAMFWRADTSAGLNANLIGMHLLDRSPDWDRLVAKHRWVSRVAPLLRSRPVEPPLRAGRPFWADDPHFEVERHLRRVRLPAPGSHRQLLDFAQALAMSAFPAGWPLWEAVLVEGVNGHGAAYLLKLHHSLTDGTGASQLVYLLTDEEADPPLPELPPPPGPGRARTNRGLLLAGRLARTAGGAARAACRLPAARAARSAARLDGGPRASVRARDLRALLPLVPPTLLALARATVLPSIPPSPLLAGRSGRARFEMLDVPFEALRAAGKAAGGTFNDAYLAALAGGFDRYHRRFGTAVDAVPALLPISVRRPGAMAGGNHLASSRFVLPTGERSLARRVRLIHDRVAAVRGGPTLHALRLLSRPITPLPPSWVAGVTMQLFRGNDLLASNFAGINRQVHLAGAKVTAIVPYAPLLCGAVSIALVSYQDRACLGITLDSAAVTEPDVFVACLREGFDEVIASLPAGQAPAAPERAASRNH